MSATDCFVLAGLGIPGALGFVGLLVLLCLGAVWVADELEAKDPQ